MSRQYQICDCRAFTVAVCARGVLAADALKISPAAWDRGLVRGSCAMGEKTLESWWRISDDSGQNPCWLDSWLVGGFVSPGGAVRMGIPILRINQQSC